ncbi:MAG: cytochrome c oxidase assembly protein, partial [Gammaproteobacteria bacterium]|nr:cytochrome c oxidase assembly protein [Gammaproteobacteria bacterium]
MFGFGFALVPLYDVFCDVTGLNGKTGGQVTSSETQEID